MLRKSVADTNNNDDNNDINTRNEQLAAISSVEHVVTATELESIAVDDDDGHRSVPAAVDDDDDDTNVRLVFPPTGGGCTLSVFHNEVLRKPRGQLRLVEWLCALVAFAAAADTSNPRQRGISDSISFLVVVGVCGWIWTMAMTTGYCWHSYRRFENALMIELVIDALLTLFFFCASVALASRCNTHTMEVRRCSGTSKPEAAAVFGFLCFFCWIGSTGLAYHQWNSIAIRRRQLEI